MPRKLFLPSLLQTREELIQASPPPHFVVEVVFPDTSHRAKFTDYAAARDYFALFTVLPCSVVLRRIRDFFTEDEIIKKVQTNADYSRSM